MNLILCGMMGAGKSSVGKELSALMGWQFVDTDEKIEERYGKITDIFARFGETRFREMETEFLQALSKERHLIVATGGGMVLKEENVALLKEMGKIVYLRAKIDTLATRLKADKDRPLLQGGAIDSRLESLSAERTEHYEKAADFTLDVDGKTPLQIAKEILFLWT